MDTEYLNKNELKLKYLNTYNINYVYKNNLNKLKYSKYFKYIPYKEYVEYLEKYNKDNLTILNYINDPITFKSFEYLCKKKLYNIAYNYSWIFDIDKSFKNILKGNILKYIQDKDMSFKELMVFKLNDYNINRYESFIESINLTDSDTNYYWLLYNKVNKNINKYLIKLIKQDYSIEEYYNYINNCIELELDININDIIFPEDFSTLYSMVSDDLYFKNNPNEKKSIEDGISNIGNTLNLINTFEDNKYIVFACPTYKDLIEESINMHNCVRYYYDFIITGSSQIYFMRNKNNIKESLVSFEVYDPNRYYI